MFVGMEFSFKLKSFFVPLFIIKLVYFEKGVNIYGIKYNDSKVTSPENKQHAAKLCTFVQFFRISKLNNFRNYASGNIRYL